MVQNQIELFEVKQTNTQNYDKKTPVEIDKLLQAVSAQRDSDKGFYYLEVLKYSWFTCNFVPNVTSRGLPLL